VGARRLTHRRRRRRRNRLSPRFAARRSRGPPEERVQRPGGRGRSVRGLRRAADDPHHCCLEHGIAPVVVM
jgi:hypothetical protein